MKAYTSIDIAVESEYVRLKGKGVNKKKRLCKQWFHLLVLFKY